MANKIISKENFAVYGDKIVDHIISQHDSLQKTVEKLKNELATAIQERDCLEDEVDCLEDEVDCLEDEVDGLTKSKNMIQMYMKNYHEMHKIEVSIRNNHEKINDNIIPYYYNILFGTIMFYCLVFHVTNTVNQIMAYILFISTIIGTTLHMRKYNILITNKNNILYEELKKLKKSVDIVHDMLDNL
jgi:uncharacterized protein YoxC